MIINYQPYCKNSLYCPLLFSCECHYYHNKDMVSKIPCVHYVHGECSFGRLCHKWHPPIETVHNLLLGLYRHCLDFYPYYSNITYRNIINLILNKLSQDQKKFNNIKINKTKAKILLGNELLDLLG